MNRISQAAKMIAALIGALLTAGTTLIPAEWNGWLGLALAVATAAATYTIPNAAPDAAGAHAADPADTSPH